MILIADSGSTKTHWLYVGNNGQTRLFDTIGFNPFYVDAVRITDELNMSLVHDLPVSEIQKVFFYGAGCSTSFHEQIIKDGLVPVFNNAQIEVSGDVLGAARALFHKDTGIAIILGTGASSCEYNGSGILNKTAALGYILGDEGSGAVLGKRLLQGFLNNEFPALLQKVFSSRFQEDVETIKAKVYSGERPNQYLATFTAFILERIKEPYLRNLVEESFIKMFNYQLGSYQDWQTKEVRLLGSVAWYFSEILNEVASNKGVRVTRILKSPIQDLARYHLGSG